MSGLTFEEVVGALTKLRKEYRPDDLGGPRCCRCWKEYEFVDGVPTEQLLLFEMNTDTGEIGLGMHYRCFKTMPKEWRDAILPPEMQ